MNTSAKDSETSELSSPGKSAHGLILTLNRIKSFIKEDAEVKSISTEACFAVAKATELLLEAISQKAAKQMHQRESSEICYNDVAFTVASWDALDFLQDIVPKKIPAAVVLERMKQMPDAPS